MLWCQKEWDAVTPRSEEESESEHLISEISKLLSPILQRQNGLRDIQSQLSSVDIRTDYRSEEENESLHLPAFDKSQSE